MHQLTKLGAILSTVLASNAALAEPAVDPATESATVNLREGNAALVQGRPEEALAKFSEAYRQLPSPKIHYNLGQAHSMIPGHEAQAYEEMSRFLDAARHAEPALLLAADKQRKQLRKKVGIVTVVADPADADLIVDDVNVGKVSAEWPTVLGIGTHRLGLTKNAASSEVQTITIAGDDVKEVNLHLAQNTPIVVTKKPPPPRQTLDNSTWRHRVGLSLAVLSGASLVFGIVEHVNYFGKASDFKNAGCGTSNLSAGQNCKSLNDQFNSAHAWWVVGYIGAAVLGGGGGYLLWLAPADAPKDGGGVASANFGMTFNYLGRF